jgi:hypothetical protein
MTQGESSGGSLSIFIFLLFSCIYKTQNNNHFTKFGCDRPLSSFFFALVGFIVCVTVVPVVPECHDIMTLGCYEICTKIEGCAR